jgi:hypothetical protein
MHTLLQVPKNLLSHFEHYNIFFYIIHALCFNAYTPSGAKEIFCPTLRYKVIYSVEVDDDKLLQV